MTAIRDAYGAALQKLGKENSRVVALEADVGGSTKSCLFGSEYKERYYNTGICELNMVNMAAGLALEGFIPFVNTFSIFLTTRGLDPIQSLLAYDQLNVKLAGTYCGLSDSYDGASHQAITDIAIMRAIPNMTVVSVCDETETKKAVEALTEMEGPAYLRLSRAPAPVIYDGDMKFQLGKGIQLKEGNDVAIVATGTILHRCLKAAEILKMQGIEASVADIHTIKPLDKDMIVSLARKTGAIVTVEEHSVNGGLGEAVAQVLAKEYPVRMDMIGMETFAESGDYDALLDKYGYSPEEIALRCLALIKRKGN